MLFGTRINNVVPMPKTSQKIDIQKLVPNKCLLVRTHPKSQRNDWLLRRFRRYYYYYYCLSVQRPGKHWLASMLKHLDRFRHYVNQLFNWFTVLSCFNQDWFIEICAWSEIGAWVVEKPNPLRTLLLTCSGRQLSKRCPMSRHTLGTSLH